MLSKGTTTTDYRNAPSNSGPLAAQWIDKPHRLIYDLCGEVERLWAFERPPDFPEIVCLCGSTRFMEAFFEVGWQLTLEGKIVLSVGVCKHAEDHGGEALGQEVADRLDELHCRKIDLADRVMILNVGGYIGESTRRELDYARSLGKPVTFLEPDALIAKEPE